MSLQQIIEIAESFKRKTENLLYMPQIIELRGLATLLTEVTAIEIRKLQEQPQPPDNRQLQLPEPTTEPENVA